MNEPVTTIDPRYSDPASVATPWEETHSVLETAELFWLSTVRADGRPHATPVVAIWFNGALHFCTDQPGQKVVNFRANPHVLLTTGCTWNSGLDIVVEGDAVQITDHAQLEHLANIWATKWDRRFQFVVRDGVFYNPGDDEPVPVFAVTPSRAFAFATNTTASHTRYMF